MAETTSDFLIHRLKEWGVNRIYGDPGDGINGILGALQRMNGSMDFVPPGPDVAMPFTTLSSS